MMVKLLVGLLSALLLAPVAPVHAMPPEFEIRSEKISTAVTTGGNQRGPALAVLQDGTLILGGGKTGGQIFLYEIPSKKLTRVASVLPNNRRIVDSRFAINDIAVLSQTSWNAKLLVSYPRLGSSRKCVEIVIDEVNLNLITKKATEAATWFVTKPCVPISAVQHTSGRFAVIDANSAYVTIGDLGYRQIGDRKKRGDLGSIFKVSARSAVKVSQGHRNAQGIVLFDNLHLLAAEHGPRGGDELNRIRQGGDYGWPFVTYGEPYGLGDYVRPTRTGTHVGFIEPLTYWVPSIAPTELVQLPKEGWGQWSGQLMLGTLARESLVLMKLDQNLAVTDQEIVRVGERIRDLEVLSATQVAATTDSGKLMIISLRR
jgi:glucose/arabinose dehydrogenase